MQPHGKVAILGFGKEGASALRFLKRSSQHKKTSIAIRDQKQGDHYLDHLDSYDLIVKSPGIPWHTPEIVQALKRGVQCTTPTALFFERAKGILIGITGTKGKGTTATLLYRMLKAHHKSVFLAGNIGTPMLDILPRLTPHSITILELSSFQLERLPHSPDVAVMLEIFPDHLDHHRSMREYINAKASLANHQTQKDTMFFFAQSAYAKHIAQKSKAKKCAVEVKKFVLFEERDLRLLGAHNFANAVMAATVARHFRVPERTIKKVALSFKGNPHRLEFVAKKRGILFYNDSAATIPHATIAAIHSIIQPVLLIMGGVSKNVDDKPLKEAIEAAPHIKAVFDGMRLSDAFAAALQKANKGDVILLSPGAASFDQFCNYEERGDAFKKLVKHL
jgi:UDP-N-acetylmuramoylalanine--D-glutamate ligase